MKYRPGRPTTNVRKDLANIAKSPLTPNELMWDAILKKDPNLLQPAIDQGADPYFIPLNAKVSMDALQCCCCNYSLELIDILLASPKIQTKYDTFAKHPLYFVGESLSLIPKEFFPKEILDIRKIQENRGEVDGNGVFIKVPENAIQEIIDKIKKAGISLPYEFLLTVLSYDDTELFEYVISNFDEKIFIEKFQYNYIYFCLLFKSANLLQYLIDHNYSLPQIPKNKSPMFFEVMTLPGDYKPQGYPKEYLGKKIKEFNQKIIPILKKHFPDLVDYFIMVYFTHTTFSSIEDMIALFHENNIVVTSDHLGFVIVRDMDQQLQKILNSKLEIQSKHNLLQSLLSLSVIANATNCIKALLKRGANINIHPMEATDPFLFTLLEIGDHSPILNNIKSTTLDLCISQENLVIFPYYTTKNFLGGIQEQYGHHQNFIVKITKICNKKEQQLEQAIRTGDTKTVQRLLRYHSDVLLCNELLQDILPKINRSDIISAGFHSALTYASSWGKTDIVKFLLENNADIEYILEGHDWTALHIAAFSGHLSVVKELVEHGADIWKKDWSMERTPFMRAVEKGHLEIVKYFIELDKNFINDTDDKDYTPLTLSENKGHTDLIQFFKSL